MPADDLVLNVRQIASYTAVDPALPSDALLIQRGGLGGPYQSMSAEVLIATGLAGSGLPFQLIDAPADAVGAQIFTDGLVTPLGGWWQFNAYGNTSNVALLLESGPAGAIQFGPTVGWVFQWGAPGAADTPVSWTEQFAISPVGYVTVGNQIALGRDPIAPMEAATAQWVAASTVTSFNGRNGVVQLSLSDIVSAGGAPNYSPFFGGAPQAPTPQPADCSPKLATTAFVHQSIVTYIQSLLDNEPLVSSFNGRTGAVVLTAADVTALTLPYAPLNSPNFTGYATSLTPPQGTSDGQIATTAFVMNAVAESVTGVASFNGRTGLVVLSGADLTSAGGALLVSPTFTGTPQAPTAAPGTNTAQLATCAFVAASTGAGFAPINSPAFTGTPTAPTAALSTSTTQLATCAFVMNEITAVNAGVISFNGRQGAVTLLANDISAAGGATLASPIFTGLPSAPTANPGTNTTQLATTQFVAAAIAALPAVPIASTTAPLMNGTATAGVATAWSRGDHVHPTDTSRAAQASLASYLLLAGGTMTGNLNAQGVAASNINDSGNLTVGGTATVGGNCYFAYNAVTDFFATGTIANRQLQFFGGSAVNVATGTGTFSWTWSNTSMFHCGPDGTFTVGTLVQTSDADGKLDLADYDGGLADLMQLRPRSFKRLTPADRNRAVGASELGFVHQEVRPVREEFGPISGETKGISPTALLACAVAAIQELSAKVDALLGRIDQLETVR